MGKQLALRILSGVAQILNLKEGDDVGVQVSDGKSILLAVSESREDILKRVRACGGKLPQGFRFDREEANARELPEGERYRLSIRDSSMLACGLPAGCDSLWSEYLRDGLAIDGRLTVRNPFG